MAIIGKTFNFQTVSAGDDGALYRMLAGRVDLFRSFATPTISNNVLTFSESYMFLCGRFMRISNGTAIPLGTIPTSHTIGRVIVKLDMTKLATESSLMQIETEIETATSSSNFRALTTNDINTIDGQNYGLYESELLRFTCSSGTASAPVLSKEQITYPLPIALGGTGATAKGNALLNISAMNYATESDFNNLRLSGIYAINGATTPTNHPTGGSDYGTLIVLNAREDYTGTYSFVTQIFITLFGERVFTRTYANGAWRGWRGRTGDVMQIAMTSQALSALTATRIKFGTATAIDGTGFGTWASDNSYITLPKGLYRFSTHFVANPDANGFIRSCLKIGSTSTTMIATDHLFTGAGCGSNSLLFGINASEVVSLSGSTNIYFLAYSYNAIQSFQANVQIERLG